MKSFARRNLETAFGRLESLISSQRSHDAKAAKRQAFGFNVFDFIKPAENTLSDILRFLLDPLASHGQSDLFLKSLITAVRPHGSFSTVDATVVREAPTYTMSRTRRRMDILVTLTTFCLAIETKKFSAEGPRQIHDYCEHLDTISNGSFCLIFLNRTGSEAMSIVPGLATARQKKDQLVIWSWEKSVPAWLDHCKALVAPQKIKHFLGDFKEYIARYLATKEDTEDANEK